MKNLILILFYFFLSSNAFGENVPILDIKSNPKKIVLFIGSENIQTFHKNLIEKLPDTQFFVFKSSFVKYLPKFYFSKNVKLTQLDFPITDWVQDRIFRSKDFASNTLYISSTYSDHLVDNNISPFELNIPLQLENLSISKIHENSVKKSISKPGTKDIEITNFSSQLNRVTGFILPDLIGDGGDRIVTENYIFIGKSTLKKNNIEAIKRRFNKEIIALDSEIEYERYLFHIDMFITPIDNTIILGSISESFKHFGRANWMDLAKMDSKIIYEQQIIEQLKNNNFNIIRIPLFYTKNEGLITFNNGIFTKNFFLSVNYKLEDQEAQKAIEESKLILKTEFKKLNFDVDFIDGGELNINNGGQLRCSVGIIDQEI